MIHGQYGIKLAVLTAAKETVGGKRAETLYIPGHHLFNGRLDNLILLLADESVIAGMGIER